LPRGIEFRPMLYENSSAKSPVLESKSRLVAFDYALATPEDVWNLALPVGTRHIRVRKIGTDRVAFYEAVFGKPDSVRRLGNRDVFTLEELRTPGAIQLARETFLGLVNKGLLVVGAFGSSGVGMITEGAEEAISMIVTLAVAGEGIVIPTTETLIVRIEEDKNSWIDDSLTQDFIKVFDLGLRLLSTPSIPSPVPLPEPLI
jgi:hypothetical protein